MADNQLQIDNSLDLSQISPSSESPSLQKDEMTVVAETLVDCPANLAQQCKADKKLMVFDALCQVPELRGECDFVEVQFKNTRKGYYLNHQHLDLHKGDIVAVEGNPGHDIGEVTLTGYLVHLQMKKANYHFDDPEAVRKVFRLAKSSDMERYREAKAKEHDTMLRSRKIAEDLHLEMKIGDVEYQGDGNKAIFYYIADGRVDFRQLIKVLADVFKVRIEMKQIGARQEAGRIGGIGPCGRELCCAKWMTKFMSVGTAAARFQDLSLNPQKLAGQCAKLKCCLNYEVDCYMEANKEVPGKDIVLHTQDAEYHLFKTDILSRMVTYSTSKDGPFNLVTISASRAFEVYGLNKRGIHPESLLAEPKDAEHRPEFSDGVGDEELTRFDARRKPRRKRNKSRERMGGSATEQQGGKPALKDPHSKPDRPQSGDKISDEEMRIREAIGTAPHPAESADVARPSGEHRRGRDRGRGGRFNRGNHKPSAEKGANNNSKGGEK